MRVNIMEIESERDKAQALQNRLYFILEKLQAMSREVPSKYQQRISIELLSGLANTLLHDTIFEIVKGLKEIQDVTEKHFFHSRLRLLEVHRKQRQDLIETIGKNHPSFENDMKKLRRQQQLKVAEHDREVILQLDEKVHEQQSMLETAGVPGFHVTNDPSEISVQMYLLQFILKLSKMNLPYVSLDE